MTASHARFLQLAGVAPEVNLREIKAGISRPNVNKVVYYGFNKKSKDLKQI